MNITSKYFRNPTPVKTFYSCDTPYQTKTKMPISKTVRLHSSAKNKIRLLPNLATEQIIVEAIEDKLPNFRIYDETGKDVSAAIKIIKMSFTRMLIDLENLEPSDYIIEIA